MLLFALSSTVLLANHDVCSEAVALTMNGCGSPVAGNTLDATDDGFFSCDSFGENAGLWYSFVAPATTAVTIFVTDGGPGNPEAAVFDACGGNEIACSASPDELLLAGLVPGSTYYVVVWGDVTFGQGPFTICVNEFVPEPNDVCSGATALTVGACPTNAVAGNTLDATPDGDFTCDTAGENAGLWYSFVAPATTAINIQVTDGGPGNPEAAIFDACGGTEIWCDGSPDNEIVGDLTPGNTYYVVVWGDVTFGQGPFTICVDQFVTTPNDDCAGATDLSTMTSPLTGNTCLATNTEDVSCLNASTDLFYFIDVPAGATLTIGQPSNSYDSRHRAAWGGACPGTNEIACTDDPDTEMVTWVNQTGMTQRVYWTQEAFSVAGCGEFQLAWTVTAAPPVANDDCDSATTIGCETTTSGSTLGAGVDGVNDCGTGSTSAGVWYTFTATLTDRFYTVSTCNDSDFDTEISIFTGSCDDLDCLVSVGQSNGCDGGSSVTFTPILGQPVYILVTGTGTTQGTFNLTLECDDAFILGCTDPEANNFNPDANLDDGSCEYDDTNTGAPNDLCSGAIALTVGDCASNAVAGDTGEATDDGFFSCDSFGENAGLWYSFVAPASGDINIQVSDGGPGNPEAAIFDACGGTEVWCDGSPDNEIVTGLIGGNTYYVVVWGDVTAGQGPFTICVDEFVPLANDDCDDAQPITVAPPNMCSDFAVSGTTFGAMDDGPQTCDGTTNNMGVWYSFVAPPSGSIILMVTELSGNHEAALYDACDGTSVFCDGTPNNETITGLIGGNTYYLLIWSDAGTSQGNHTVCVEELATPANDMCMDAESIGCGSVVVGTTEFASANGNSCDGDDDDEVGVWYTFTGVFARFATLSTCGSDVDTKISLYTGSCDNLTCVTSNDDFCGEQSAVTFLPTVGQTYYVYVQTLDETGEFTLTYTCDLFGIQDSGSDVAQTQSTDLHLYPNPAFNELNVSMGDFLGKRVTLDVRNQLGQVMLQRTINEVEVPVQQLNLMDMPAGLYYLTVSVDGEGTFTKKFMVTDVRP